MRFTMNLNKTATLAMTGASKLRLKVADGQLMIKPTDRTAGGLPKDEKMVKISKRSTNTAKFSLRGNFDGLALSCFETLGVTPAKHGWFVLGVADDMLSDAPTVKVSAS